MAEKPLRETIYARGDKDRPADDEKKAKVKAESKSKSTEVKKDADK